MIYRFFLSNPIRSLGKKISRLQSFYELMRVENVNNRLRALNKMQTKINFNTGCLLNCVNQIRCITKSLRHQRFHTMGLRACPQRSADASQCQSPNIVFLCVQRSVPISVISKYSAVKNTRKIGKSCPSLVRCSTICFMFSSTAELIKAEAALQTTKYSVS